MDAIEEIIKSLQKVQNSLSEKVGKPEYLGQYALFIKEIIDIETTIHVLLKLRKSKKGKDGSAT